MVRRVLAVTMVLAALGPSQAQEPPKERYKICLVAPLLTSIGCQSFGVRSSKAGVILSSLWRQR